MRIALYARVSTPQQHLTHTIEQQLARLRAHVLTQPTWSLTDEHIFCDDGCSGAQLKRPALDHLRDEAAQAGFDLVLMTAPDRLARNYVHQMVVLEELTRSGCQVQFLDRPMSNDPHDQLVLQVRGAVAEYERTLIAERMRRGRLNKLRSGQLLPWVRAPFGYRLHPERPRDPAFVTVDLAQAAIIQELFSTYADGEVSLYQLSSRLAERGICSPMGRGHWTPGSLRLILSNPCYTGVAYANRIQMRAATQRRSAVVPVGPGVGWCYRPRDEWIGIPVPAIISVDIFQRVQERLATNQRQARRNTQHAYLLRGLVCCGHCRFHCEGRFRPPAYVYYVCHGHRTPRKGDHAKRCPAQYIPAQQLETLVWADLCEVVQHPEVVTQALERAQSGGWLPEELQRRHESVKSAVRSLEHQRERLLRAYLAGVIELEEFERRQRELVQQMEDLQGQARQLGTYSDQLLRLRETIPTIEALCERLQAGLEYATVEQRRQIVELLIDSIVVTGSKVEIRYVIPTTEASTHIRFCHLRLDYFGAPLHAHLVAIRSSG